MTTKEPAFARRLRRGKPALVRRLPPPLHFGAAIDGGLKMEDGKCKNIEDEDDAVCNLFWCREIRLDQTESNWIKPVIFKTLNDRRL